MATSASRRSRMSSARPLPTAMAWTAMPESFSNSGSSVASRPEFSTLVVVAMCIRPAGRAQPTASASANRSRRTEPAGCERDCGRTSPAGFSPPDPCGGLKPAAYDPKSVNPGASGLERGVRARVEARGFERMADVGEGPVAGLVAELGQSAVDRVHPETDGFQWNAATARRSASAVATRSCESGLGGSAFRSGSSSSSLARAGAVFSDMPDKIAQDWPQCEPRVS